MEKLRCCVCGTSKNQEEITISSRRDIVCKKCLPYYTDYHFNTFDLENGKVVERTIFDGFDESKQRYLFIDYVHLLMNGKVDKRTYSMINGYKKAYSFLEMIRALEYHYKIKNNSIEKAKGSIGIIPHVMKNSNQYYAAKNKFLRERFESQILAEKQEQEKVVQITQQASKKEKIDIMSLFKE